MTSCSRPFRGKLRALAAAFLFLILFGQPLSAFAAPTCGPASSESGGSHKRCSSSNGVFHVWTPSGFDASKAGYTVVYVHGYSDQCAAPSSQDASDGVPDTWFNAPGAAYVDGVWTAHNLASQFAASGLSNALFVATQAPTCNTNITAKDPAHVDNNEHWPDFNTLLDDLRNAGVTRPNGPIVLIGHSGAYRELSDWQNDNSGITHIIHLDTLYVSDGFADWMNASGHTASVVATQGETIDHGKANTVMSAVSGTVKLSSLPGSLSGMSSAAKNARVLYAVSTSLTHMGLITSGSVIPMLLQRMLFAGAAAPSPSGQAPVPQNAPTAGGTTTTTAPRVDYIPPRLEIPIPYVNFSNLVSGDSAITVPWIGQYVAGVYTFLLSIVGVVAAAMMIIGGFQYLTSAGDKTRIAKGKKRIVDALIGMVLAFGSYLMLYTINPALVTFSGLQIATVQPHLYGEGTDGGAPLGPDSGVQGTPTPPPVAAGSNARICASAADCLPYCAAAGCSKVYCFKGEQGCPPTDLPGFSGVSLQSTSNPWSNGCATGRFPVIPPGAPVQNITWTGIHNVIPNGQQASQLVIEGLQRAENYIDQNYAGQGLQITLRNCYRDARGDFGSQCAIIMRPGPNNDPSSSSMGSTWPGPNPHSSGYACDLALVQNGKVITPGDLSSQRCTKYTDAEKLLVGILTNSYVGARRLNYEYWHFNWAGWNECYCALGECDQHIAPVGCHKNSPLNC